MHKKSLRTTATESKDLISCWCGVWAKQ